MLNFTVGPVQIHQDIRKIGAEEIPYFRTKEFSELMKENEHIIKKLFNAPDDAKSVFLTGSGTAAMEAAVMNFFNQNDKLIVVNGGSFGERFAQICKIHEICFSEIKLNYGEMLTQEHFTNYENSGFTGLLVNLHETSTGVLYDIDIISEFCKRNNLILVVDAISAFLADEVNMIKHNIDAVITSSQKALALPPGLSVIVMKNKMQQLINNNDVKSMYMNLRDCLKNSERGQTPFTPAVGILIQLNQRLKMIDEIGIEEERKKIVTIASDFRKKIKDLPFRIVSASLSNAVTPLTHIGGVSAYRIFEILKDEYGIFVCPNGGILADKMFRVGHIGCLTTKDNDTLIAAFVDMKKRGLI